MSNIKKLPTRKITQRKSSVVPFKRGERGVVINLEEKINKAIEIRLGRFVKEIQMIKAKQKKIEARQKKKCEKGTLESIGKMKDIKSKPKLKQKAKSTTNKTNNKKTKK